MLKYQHGGDVKAFARQCDCKVSEVIDLSSNINFVKPTLDINFNHLDISSYPDYEVLYHSIVLRYNVKHSEVELFNGATTAIDMFFRTLGLKHCTLYAPLYAEYHRSAKRYGYDIDFINRFENIGQEVKANSLVVFVNPSTPDGKYYNLDKLMTEWIKKECTILIDESFLDFTIFKSTTKYLKSYDKLYIVKSMTKFYSSAGIRIGVLLSNTKNINAIQQKEPLWKISQFDSQYIQSALRDRTFTNTSHRINAKNRTDLIEILENCSLIQKVYNSDVNFILTKLKNIDAHTFQKKLMPYKIMIRNCENFDFLDSSFVRIAVKDSIALNTLKDALCEISI